MSIRDEKYIVFKRSDWEADGGAAAVMAVPLEDAVVIRTKDVFAGPALHTYAGSIATASRIIATTDHLSESLVEQALHLQRTADYFHQRAVEADEAYGRLPD